MATSQAEILRRLRVAFTTQELETLQTDARFERALRHCRGSQAEIRDLVGLGGAMLAELHREKFKLRKSSDND